VSPAGAGSSPAGHPSLADAEHWRAQRAVTPPPRAVVVRLHPSAPRFLGTTLCGEHPRLHRGHSGFDSRRLHLASVVSTASTRPLYGRGAGSTPAGGSSDARSSADERCPATAEDAGSTPAGRVHADVAQSAEHRAANPGRPVRSGSSALTGPWCNGAALRAPTSPVRVRILAGLSSRAGAARFSSG
jgi:hypothetical protein